MIKRYPWENFPPVWIHANESSVKQHPAYRAAKSGDPDAAYQLVNAQLNSTIIGQLATRFATQKPVLVSAHAVEGSGVNAIPEALADMLAQRLSWTADTAIIQTNIVGHKGGGTVLGATVLTGKPHSANIALTASTLEQLRQKHGSTLEYWWQQRFGFGLDCLTESEARYLLNTPHVDRIRNQIIAAS